MTQVLVASAPLPIRSADEATAEIEKGISAAGLSAAYELNKAGYACTVLEARDRGRNWTMRRGSKLEMTNGTRQVCDFIGPARLPSHHQAVLGYCRQGGPTGQSNK